MTPRALASLPKVLGCGLALSPRSIATIVLGLTPEALAGFCNEELLVEPEKLVKAWLEPMLPKIEKLKNLQHPPEVDKERLKEYQEALRQGWRYSDNN